MPGGSVVVGGTTYALAPSATALIVDGTVSVIPSPANLPALVLNGQTYAATVSGTVTGFVIAPGTTLLPGGPAITISGTTVSLPASGTPAPFVLVNGATSSFAANNALPTASPALTIGTRTFTPVISGSSTFYPITSGVTLTPGGVVTVDGTVVSLSPDQTIAVVGSSTVTLKPASTAAGVTTSGLGGYVASGLGYTGPAATATGGAGKHTSCHRHGLEGWVLGIVAWCLRFM